MNRVSNLPFRRMIEAPDFWRLWYVGLIVATVRWVETVAVGVVVYQRTDSAFLVSMMTMLRLLPMGLFGAFLGELAERFDRGRTLLTVVVLMSGTSTVLAILDQTGQLEIWHLALASFINGCGWSTDNPVRRVMMGEVVGRDQMGTAMSLDVGANNASRMVGPAAGGFLLAGTGIQGAFVLSVLMYCTALFAIVTIRSRIPRAVNSGAMLARIAEGLALVRTDTRLIGVLIVTVIYNLFAWPFTSMIPVIGRDRLHLGPEGVGLLATMDGVGAFIGVIFLYSLVRLGYAFGGRPAGKDKFFPFHAELRANYWFGSAPFESSGVRPYLSLSGGLAEVDAKVPVEYYNANNQKGTLDAWRKTGTGFASLAFGVMVPFAGDNGIVPELRAMQMFGASGTVFSIAIGYARAIPTTQRCKRPGPTHR